MGVFDNHLEKKMAGMKEDLDDRKVAEAIAIALEAKFPGQTYGVKYIVRDDIWQMDQHQIIRRRGILGFPLPLLFGEVQCQYCGAGHCYVENPSILTTVESVVSEAQMHPERMRAITA